MKASKYLVKFHLPAFLGNADQSGQWRTPPFKAQLRQWWRMAFAAQCDFRPDLETLRRIEGKLFGNAWLADDFAKSLVRIRLAQWTEGSLRDWEQPDPPIRSSSTKGSVGSQLYLGYGPLTLKNRATALKANAAIQAGNTNTLAIAYPDSDAKLIDQALALMDEYGTVGGRSRNGWGSFGLEPREGTQPLACEPPLRDWREALELDWPHAIGRDDYGALIWQTRPFDHWRQVMQELAGLKKTLRSQFSFNSRSDAQLPEDRHWLSYPVTKHPVKSWGNNLRLPNTLRYKVRITSNKPVGVIFHVPCLPPNSFKPRRDAIERVWQRVHATLDSAAGQLTRISK